VRFGRRRDPAGYDASWVCKVARNHNVFMESWAWWTSIDSEALTRFCVKGKLGMGAYSNFFFKHTQAELVGEIFYYNVTVHGPTTTFF
jgi:hypothetical protein